MSSAGGPTSGWRRCVELCAFMQYELVVPPGAEWGQVTAVVSAMVGCSECPISVRFTFNSSAFRTDAAGNIVESFTLSNPVLQIDPKVGRLVIAGTDVLAADALWRLVEQGSIGAALERLGLPASRAGDMLYAAAVEAVSAHGIGKVIVDWAHDVLAAGRVDAPIPSPSWFQR